MAWAPSVAALAAAAGRVFLGPGGMPLTLIVWWHYVSVICGCGCSSSHQPVEFQIGVSMPSGASHSSRHHSRHKRLARSQIPSQPVEMPKGTYPEVYMCIHTSSVTVCLYLCSVCVYVGLQMSELGIAFVGLELQASSATELPRDEPATTTTQVYIHVHMA